MSPRSPSKFRQRLELTAGALVVLATTAAGIAHLHTIALGD
jgi:hypothetical protein